MSYKRGWSKTFKPAEFYITSILGKSPDICDEHAGEFCFRSDIGGALEFYAGGGIWVLSTPIPIDSVMPGTKQKVLSLSAVAMWNGWGGLFGPSLIGELALYANVLVLKKKLTYEFDVWRENKFEDLNIDISKKSVLALSLQQKTVAGGLSTSTTQHVALVTVGCEYYATTPPPTSTVKITVVNKQTSKAVKNAYVVLLIGTSIEADGYTDSNGELVFQNVTQGGYILSVRANGYYSFESAIEIEGASVWYQVKLAPTPSVPLPDWVKYAAIGGVALVSVVGVGTILKRREEKVMVVRA